MDEASSSTPPPPSNLNHLKTTPSSSSELFSLLTDDLLHNILARLPAPSFASAACVSKSWCHVCSLILSRPKLASALSLHPNLLVAWDAVTRKVLAEPIRPHFVIANVSSEFRLVAVYDLMLERFGSRVPIVVSVASGVFGRDADSGEVKSEEEEAGENAEEDGSCGILLTVGFVPGLKVEAIPLLSTIAYEDQRVFMDGFLASIRDYTASVSDCSAPVGIIMFRDGCSNMRPVVDALDYAMPKETIIVGDEKGRFLHKSENEFRNLCRGANLISVAVALVLARDRETACGDIQFHLALSEGLSTVGPKHKAVSVRASSSDSTWLTARREGNWEVLDGQRILDDINDELQDHTDSSDLYIGVKKRRSVSTGSKKRRLVTSLDFHGVTGGDEEYLYVNDIGIKTGDYFHFYRPDSRTALSSSANLSASLKNVNPTEVFGGLIFACCGRGESFFGHVNVDSIPFVENFPGVTLGGIFCGGEIGRGSSILNKEAQKDIKCNLHVYSCLMGERKNTSLPKQIPTVEGGMKAVCYDHHVTDPVIVGIAPSSGGRTVGFFVPDKKEHGTQTFLTAFSCLSQLTGNVDNEKQKCAHASSMICTIFPELTGVFQIALLEMNTAAVDVRNLNDVVQLVKASVYPQYFQIFEQSHEVRLLGSDRFPILINVAAKIQEDQYGTQIATPTGVNLAFVNELVQKHKDFMAANNIVPRIRSGV